MENLMLQGEVRYLRERFQGQPPDPRRISRSRPLADRIGWERRQSLPRMAVDHRGGATAARTEAIRPPTVTVSPVDIHPRFLPLGDHFQAGGTGSPMFSHPQDWPEAIRENASLRPRGVRRWGAHLVNLDDLHVYVQLGQTIYGGNRPPGRNDPVDPQRPWRAIEAAFFRATVAIILQPHALAGIYGQLTPDQRAPYRQPFLAAVEDPNRLNPKDVVQHLIRSGMIEFWFQLDTVVGFAQSYLRDWARHQSQVTTTTELGQLFQFLYPEGIPHQDDCNFVEDAANDEDTWERSGATEAPIGEEDEVPPLEPQTPSPELESSRMTPIEERVDYS